MGRLRFRRQKANGGRPPWSSDGAGPVPGWSQPAPFRSCVVPPRTIAELPLEGVGALVQQLPFGDLGNPRDVAVDTAGNVYVADFRPGCGVSKLAVGASGAVRLPFGDLAALAIAVDSVGAVYASGRDLSGRPRWLKLAPGDSEPTELPLPPLAHPADLTVDTADNLYVIDWENNDILKLQAHDGSLVRIPVHDTYDFRGLTVDSAGIIYLTADAAGIERGNNWVFKLSPGTDQPAQLPFSGLNYGHGIEVDAAGDLYVADNWAGRIVKLTTDGTLGVQLAFPHIQGATSVAVDAGGNVYAPLPIDRRVLTLSG